MIAMLMPNGVNWHEYPAAFKRGTYVRRKVFENEIDPAELEKLPEKHQARTIGITKFSRSVVVLLDMPPLVTVTNIVGVIFNDEEPTVDTK
jgi:hypothetical protein